MVPPSQLLHEIAAALLGHPQRCQGDRLGECLSIQRGSCHVPAGRHSSNARPVHQPPQHQQQGRPQIAQRSPRPGTQASQRRVGKHGGAARIPVMAMATTTAKLLTLADGEILAAICEQRGTSLNVVLSSQLQAWVAHGAPARPPAALRSPRFGLHARAPPGTRWEPARASSARPRARRRAGKSFEDSSSRLSPQQRFELARDVLCRPADAPALSGVSNLVLSATPNWAATPQQLTVRAACLPDHPQRPSSCPPPPGAGRGARLRLPRHADPRRHIVGAVAAAVAVAVARSWTGRQPGHRGPHGAASAGRAAGGHAQGHQVAGGGAGAAAGGRAGCSCC